MTVPKIYDNIGNMIPRLIQKKVLDSLLRYKKAIIILGARQVGKTTLVLDIQNILNKKGHTVLYLNCDTEEDRDQLNTTSKAKLQRLTDKIDTLIIDEAQRLDNPGLTIKVLHDQFPDKKLLLTGSSSFEVKNKLSDAMTGRFIDYILYPLSFIEVLQKQSNEINAAAAGKLLDEALLFGLYPEVYSSKRVEEKQLLLQNISTSYLFKDILSLQKVRNQRAIQDLTRALAYQLGSEVNENELANRLKIDRKTVASYLYILEQAFVIVRVRPFSKNPRREIGKLDKIYFTDIGIRNALIGDFNKLNLREDRGAIWENFLIVERLKNYAQKGVKPYIHFWRTYSGSEVDYLERLPNEPDFKAYEFKYLSDRKSKGVKSFEKEYNIAVKVVSKENFLEFISSK